MKGWLKPRRLASPNKHEPKVATTSEKPRKSGLLHNIGSFWSDPRKSIRSNIRESTSNENPQVPEILPEDMEAYAAEEFSSNRALLATNRHFNEYFESGSRELGENFPPQMQLSQQAVNTDKKHAGMTLLDRNDMSFLEIESIQCPHIPMMETIFASYDEVMPSCVMACPFLKEDGLLSDADDSTGWDVETISVEESELELLSEGSIEEFEARSSIGSTGVASIGHRATMAAEEESEMLLEEEKGTLALEILEDADTPVQTMAHISKTNEEDGMADVSRADEENEMADVSRANEENEMADVSRANEENEMADVSRANEENEMADVSRANEGKEMADVSRADEENETEDGMKARDQRRLEKEWQISDDEETEQLGAGKESAVDREEKEMVPSVTEVTVVRILDDSFETTVVGDLKVETEHPVVEAIWQKEEEVEIGKEQPTVLKEADELATAENNELLTRISDTAKPIASEINEPAGTTEIALIGMEEPSIASLKGSTANTTQLAPLVTEDPISDMKPETDMLIAAKEIADSQEVTVRPVLSTKPQRSEEAMDGTTPSPTMEETSTVKKNERIPSGFGSLTADYVSVVDEETTIPEGASVLAGSTIPAAEQVVADDAEMTPGYGEVVIPPEQETALAREEVSESKEVVSLCENTTALVTEEHTLIETDTLLENAAVTVEEGRVVVEEKPQVVESKSTTVEKAETNITADTIEEHTTAASDVAILTAGVTPGAKDPDAVPAVSKELTATVDNDVSIPCEVCAPTVDEESVVKETSASEKEIGETVNAEKAKSSSGENLSVETKEVEAEAKEILDTQVPEPEAAQQEEFKEVRESSGMELEKEDAQETALPVQPEVCAQLMEQCTGDASQQDKSELLATYQTSVGTEATATQQEEPRLLPQQKISPKPALMVTVEHQSEEILAVKATPHDHEDMQSTAKSRNPNVHETNPNVHETGDDPTPTGSTSHNEQKMPVKGFPRLKCESLSATPIPTLPAKITPRISTGRLSTARLPETSDMKTTSNDTEGTVTASPPDSPTKANFLKRKLLFEKALQIPRAGSQTERAVAALSHSRSIDSASRAQKTNVPPLSVRDVAGHTGTRKWASKKALLEAKAKFAEQNVDTDTVFSSSWVLCSPRWNAGNSRYSFAYEPVPSGNRTTEFAKLRFRSEQHEAEVRRQIQRMSKRIKWDAESRQIYEQALATPAYRRHGEEKDFLRFRRSASLPAFPTDRVNVFWMAATGTPYAAPSREVTTSRPGQRPKLVIPRGAGFPDWLLGLELLKKKALERRKYRAEKRHVTIAAVSEPPTPAAAEVIELRGQGILPEDKDYDKMNKELHFQAEHKFRSHLKSVALRKTGRLEKLLNGGDSMAGPDARADKKTPAWASNLKAPPAPSTGNAMPAAEQETSKEADVGGDTISPQKARNIFLERDAKLKAKRTETTPQAKRTSGQSSIVNKKVDAWFVAQVNKLS